MNTLALTNIDSMTSVEIAELTGKHHSHVLRDLRRLETDGVFALTIFGETEKDSQNKIRTIYRLPKREVLILTSGYSAKQRASIIDRWLELEEKKTMSPMEMVIASAQAIMKIEKEQELQALKLKELELKMNNLDSDSGYRTVRAYCKMNSLHMSYSEAQRLGKEASKYCKDHGITKGVVPDERHGTVGSYPIEVFEELLDLGENDEIT